MGSKNCSRTKVQHKTAGMNYVNNLPCGHFIQSSEYFNPVQAGDFVKYFAPSVFPCLWFNYHQTWHDGTLEQNLSK